jgi:hypothetical protein
MGEMKSRTIVPERRTLIQAVEQAQQISIADVTSAIHNQTAAIQSAVEAEHGKFLAEQAAFKAEVEKEEAFVADTTDASVQRAPVLPWIARENQQERSILQQDLMERILALSLEEVTFTISAADDDTNAAGNNAAGNNAGGNDSTGGFLFDFDAHVPIIMQLLELDANMKAMHSRLTPHVPEVEFFRNYFHRCYVLRVQVGMDEPGTIAGVVATPETEEVHGEITFDCNPPDPPPLTENNGTLPPLAPPARGSSSSSSVDALEEELRAELELDADDSGGDGVLVESAADHHHGDDDADLEAQIAAELAEEFGEDLDDADCAGDNDAVIDTDELCDDDADLEAQLEAELEANLP